MTQAVERNLACSRALAPLTAEAREASEISFHSLRHTAVTMLKAAGVSDFIAREIAGHESAAVSGQYTHLTMDDKRAAMQRLPDVTND